MLEPFLPAELPPGAVVRRRPRVGIIVPRTNTTCEAEFHSFVGSSCSAHTARMKTAAGEMTPDLIRRALTDPIEDVAACKVDVAALACTSAAMSLGQDTLLELFEGRVEGHVVLISESIRKSLSGVGANRVALFTPYTHSSNLSIAAFLESAGFEVVSAFGLGLNTSPERFAAVANLRSDFLIETIMSMDMADADTILLSCTDMPTLDIIRPLEERLGRPVLSSNKALFDDILSVLPACSN